VNVVLDSNTDVSVTMLVIAEVDYANVIQVSEVLFVKCKVHSYNRILILLILIDIPFSLDRNDAALLIVSSLNKTINALIYNIQNRSDCFTTSLPSKLTIC
jgi:hypothetical protein